MTHASPTPTPTPARPAPAAGKRRFDWSSRQGRAVIYQVLTLLIIGLAVAYLVSNTLSNMKMRGIQSGFDFLLQPAGFDIGESIINYDSDRGYWYAFLVGLLNTLKVAIVGIVLTTILGTLLGIGRFSQNALVRNFCYGYVELFRNIPVLLQLLMWYLLFTDYLPEIQNALNINNWFFLSKNGISYPTPAWALGHGLAFAGAVLGLIGAFIWQRKAQQRFEMTGVATPMLWRSMGLILGLALLGWLLGGAPSQWQLPVKTETQIEGGGALTPEYLAVLIGLVLYTSAFVAEVVRAGIASVPLGQHEAAASLGLSRGQAMRFVVLPQALRVIIPPMTNQFLNLTKNSSLAVAVGYPDLVSISNTSLNQSGRAVECIALIMVIYLMTSLITSGLMNWYNKRAAIQER